ncbi:hypothetical protein ACHAWF_015210 [Thalassiosira exigua]
MPPFHLRAPLFTLGVSLGFLPFVRPLGPLGCGFASTLTLIQPRPCKDRLASNIMDEPSSLRRSSRSRSTRWSPHFSPQGARPAKKSRYFSSASADVGGENAGEVITATALKGTAKGSLDAKSNPPAKSKGKSRSQPASNMKRKAKSPSKGGRKKKATSASTVPVERTRSFEPAWWGNVLTADSKKLHPHAASSDTPTPTPERARTDTTFLPPVHTLILGTHPSIASLDKNQMYGHPLNAFWFIAGDALGFRRSAAISPSTGKPYVYFHDHLRFGNDQILEYPQQLERMVRNGFAMWDIVAECEREGSLDTDIEQEVPNPIRKFCEGALSGIGSEHLAIKRIVIANGSTGAKFFTKHFADWFVDGKLCAAEDEMSQRVFKAAMNKAKKANGSKLEEDRINQRLIEVVCLPGVSPAAAKFTYLEKRKAWDEGCYGPGLADLEEWKRSRQQCQTPKAKTKSPRKSMSPSPSKLPATRLLSSDLATLAPENDWIDLEAPAQELRPSATLTNGQCFNWLVVDTFPEGGDDAGSAVASHQKASAWGTHDGKEWVGPIKDRVISIRETPTTTMFRILHGPTDGAGDDLRRYFRLETPLAPLYKEWSKSDARLSKIAKAIPGVRIVRQDPLECLFSFICSSNNNIPRIAKMLASFRKRYGSFMIEIPTRLGDEAGEALEIFSFPTLASLADATEEDLRDMGLGYRAKFIIETRNMLAESGGDDYLLKLRAEKDSHMVQEKLIKFSGVGRKVADCIALFSLDQDDAIPVDVHVQHIASRDYDPTVLGEAKSITPTIYKRVGDLFRDRFEHFPGWAHSLLFVAELPSFRGILPEDVVKEMDEWREHEQRKKQEKKEEGKKARIK